MNVTLLEQTVIKYLQRLTLEEQGQVLEFAQSLAGESNIGVAGKSLLSFMGTIEKEDLKLMKDAIDKDCERILPDEWYRPS